MLERYLALALVILPACDSKGTDTDSESHFACESDSDCPSEAGPTRCVAKKCEVLVTGFGGSGGCAGVACGGATSCSGAQCDASPGGRSGSGCDGASCTAAAGGAVPCDGSSCGTSSGGTLGGTICEGGTCSPPPSGSLTGTWEVIGSKLGGTPRSALVTLAPNYLIVSDWQGSFQAVLHGNAFDVTNTGESSFDDFAFTAARTAAPGDTGIIPLPLFGAWDAHAPNALGCTVQALPTTVTGTCARVQRAASWMPDLSNGRLTATRTQTLASSFGDFGGKWAITTGTGASCTVRFESTTITGTCENAGNSTGTASFTLNGDTGQGTTSRGIEFTAQRL